MNERRGKLKTTRDAFLYDKQERNRPLGTYMKVPFYQALELVATRKAYLEGGTVYVPMDNLVSILTARFRSNVRVSPSTTSSSAHHHGY